MNVQKLLAAMIAAAIIALALPAADVAAQAERGTSREIELYDRGADAIDDEKWEAAIDHFSRVVEMKGSRSDGALYWTAYALKKLGRRAEALKTIDVLAKAHPSSRWLNDAKALELELRQARGERVSPDRVEGEDLKMIAINSLMHTDPEQAYPLLEKIIRGQSSSKKVQERALFVLSQSSSARAQSLLAEIARGSASPDLQKKAIRYLGMFGNARSREILADVYGAAPSREVRKEILRAFMLSGDKSRVFALAKSERDPAVRSDAIKTLGLMGARAELASMYAGESSRNVRQDIIQALFLAGDSDRLAELSRNEQDLELRKYAIRRLAMMGQKTAPALLSFYRAEGNDDVKKALIDGLFIQGNSRALIEISKSERNRELRTSAVKKLSLMGDPEAVAYMLQILDE